MILIQAPFIYWISRLRKRGMVITMPFDQGKKTSVPLQEVVKVNLIPDSASMPAPLRKAIFVTLSGGTF